MIEITDLVKQYGKRTAVDHLSLRVEPGKIYGFLGPNGAGKTTTMNMITGYLGATSGDIVINGHNILEEPEEAKACIGYLPELPPLYMDMTVAEYLSFAADLKHLPKTEKKQMIEEAEEETGLRDVAGRLIKNLSKGYRQRVGLAQAIMGSPEIIILDEPTVGLDPKQIIEIRDLIRKLGQNHTVILSSHILSEIAEVCDHIFIISHGKLVASDSTEKLLEQMGASGDQQLTLLVKGKKETVSGLLKAQSIIDHFDAAQDAAEEGTVTVHVYGKPGADLREPLFWLFSGSRMPILGMTVASRSLEDVFLELTSDEHAEKAGEEEMAPKAAQGENVLQEEADKMPAAEETAAGKEEQ